MTKFTQDQRRAASDLRKTRSDARKALWVHLGNGWRLGPDSPPGVGWRLEGPRQPNRYYRNEAEARTAWARLTAQ